MKLTHGRSGIIGSVDLSGSETDCNLLSNNSEKQWRWMSYPGSRMVVNPRSCLGEKTGTALNMGLFYNGINELRDVQIPEFILNGLQQAACKISHCWYPHKLTTRAEYNCGTAEITDFFADKDTLVRLIDASLTHKAGLRIGGKVSGRISADGDFVIETGGRMLKISVFMTSGKNSVRAMLISDEDGWRAEIPCGFQWEITVTVSLKPVADICEPRRLLDRTKTYWDAKFSRIPAPKKWGIDAVLSKGITPEMHRLTFYAAWAFIYQNILEPTTETGYNHYQVTLGKASLWGNGSPKAPNSCSWESMFCIEQLAMLEPETAWDAAVGFFDEIASDGTSPGECLPSQKAHMAWCCHVNLHDCEKLDIYYPKIRCYLLWRFDNPRWVFGEHNYSDEKDISFVVQWFSDVHYAKLICAELGISEDIKMWTELEQEMRKNMEKWFFTPEDSECENKIYNTYFSTSGAHYAYDRQSDVENYILPSLYLDLPPKLSTVTKQHFLDLYDKDCDICGLDFYKYGDSCYTALGLVKHSKGNERIASAHRCFINSAMRHVMLTGEFSEESRPDVYEPSGVIPSSFGACTIIDFTYQNNGVRIDSGDFELI